MGGTTKSDQIRALYAELRGHVPEDQIMAAIAAKVGCSTTYARVVARQRGEGVSEADRRYRPTARKLRRDRYRRDTEYRAKLLESMRAWYHKNYRKKRSAPAESV